MEYHLTSALIMNTKCNDEIHNVISTLGTIGFLSQGIDWTIAYNKSKINADTDRI